jgi:hypothetical protein
VLRNPGKQKFTVSFSGKNHYAISRMKMRTELCPYSVSPCLPFGYGLLVQGFFIRGDDRAGCNQTVLGGQDEPRLTMCLNILTSLCKQRRGIKVPRLG